MPRNEARNPPALGRQRARQLDQRLRRDRRALAQQLQERAERDAVPVNDAEPLPKIN